MWNDTHSSQSVPVYKTSLVNAATNTPEQQCAGPVFPYFHSQEIRAPPTGIKETTVAK